ncbi:MAG: aminotransferase class IV [Phycisphaeraceae bacterium]
MKIFLDGQFVEADAAHVSALDAGFQHGVGLFETMQAFNGRVFRLEAHIDRLIASAKELGLSNKLRAAPLGELVERTVHENEMTEARVRLTVTGGDLSLLNTKPTASGGGESRNHQPTVLCVATVPTEYPAAFFDDGVIAVIADPKANPFDPSAGHKTLNYWMRLRTLAQAATKGAGEALWFTVTNHLCGGAVSNAFIVKEGRLFTPIARGEEPPGSLPSATLPGVTRAVVLEIAEELDIPVEKKMLSINDVLEADELFLTNSSWQVLPVVKVEGKMIGEGEGGEVTRKIRERVLLCIGRETKNMSFG